MTDRGYWAEDPYWTQALDAFYALRASRTSHLTLDLAEIEKVISEDNGVAYRLLAAMESVRAYEADEGMRGAPRLVLAALIHLANARPTSEGAPEATK